MIESNTPCYLYKATTKDPNKRIYHRVAPNNTATNSNEKWNTVNKTEAGCLTKDQWRERSTKWTYNRGWMLESINGEVEVL